MRIVCEWRRGKIPSRFLVGYPDQRERGGEHESESQKEIEDFN